MAAAPAVTAVATAAGVKRARDDCSKGGRIDGSGDAAAPGSTRLRGVELSAGWTVHGDSLLVWEHLAPASSNRIAAFDFDGCLANTPLGSNDPNAWKMQFPHVPAVLKKLNDNGFKIVVVTNESMDRLKKEEAIRNNLRKKCGRIEGFARAAGVPLQVLCATAKDDFRKPSTGAWRYLADHGNDGIAPALDSSFFVGDAAGRPGDFSDSDKNFAKAVGLRFYDEKEFFTKVHTE